MALASEFDLAEGAKVEEIIKMINAVANVMTMPYPYLYTSNEFA